MMFIKIMFINSLVFLQLINSNDTFESKQKELFENFMVHSPEESLNKSFHLLDISNSKIEYVNSYKCLAISYFLLNDIDCAHYFFDRAINESRDFDQPYTFIDCVINYSNMSDDSDYGDKILVLLFEALRKIKSAELENKKNNIKRNRQTGLVMIAIANIFEQNENYNKSKLYYESSLNYMFDNRSLQVAYHGLENVYFAQKDFKVALKYASMSDSLSDIKNPELKVIAKMKKGRNLLFLGKHDLAKKELIESLKIENSIPFSATKGDIYKYLSLLERFSNNFDKSINYLIKAKNIYYSKNDDYNLKDVMYNLVEYKLKDSLIKKDFKEFVLVLDKVNKTERVRIRNEIEAQYQLFEKESEVERAKLISNYEKRNKTIFLIITLVLFVLLIVSFIFFKVKLKLNRELLKRQNIIHSNELELIHKKFDNKILKERLKSKNEERVLLAKEIHDGLASTIALVNFSVAEKNDVELLKEKLKEVYSIIRNFSHLLSTDEVNFSLDFSDLLSELFDCLNKSNINLHVNNNTDFDLINTIDSEIAFNVFRIIQELFSNILKHSNAKNIFFNLTISESCLLEISDDGLGFDYNINKIIKNNEFSGIRNIYDRVESFGGELIFNSKKNFGTQVQVKFSI